MLKHIAVTYTVGDLYAGMHQFWRSYVSRTFILFGALVVIFTAIPVVLDGVSLRESIIWIPFELYLGLIAGVLAWVMTVSPAIAYFRLKRRGSLGPNHIAFLDEGVRIEGPKAETLFYWHAVTRVSGSKTRLFAFVGRTLIFVLPARAFDDRASFETAVEQVRALQAAAKI